MSTRAAASAAITLSDSRYIEKHYRGFRYVRGARLLRMEHRLLGKNFSNLPPGVRRDRSLTDMASEGMKETSRNSSKSAGRRPICPAGRECETGISTP